MIALLVLLPLLLWSLGRRELIVLGVRRRRNVRLVKPLGGDLAEVRADILMRESTHVVVPMGGVIIAGRSVDDHVRAVRKLVVLRGGRWYIVNGLLSDRVDQSPEGPAGDP